MDAITHLHAAFQARGSRAGLRGGAEKRCGAETVRPRYGTAERRYDRDTVRRSIGRGGPARMNVRIYPVRVARPAKRRGWLE